MNTSLFFKKHWSNILFGVLVVLMIIPQTRMPIQVVVQRLIDRKSTRLNSSHVRISYAVFCLKKKKKTYHILSSNFNLNFYTRFYYILYMFYIEFYIQLYSYILL